MSLKTLLQSERPLIMPDAYDAISAQLIEQAGFKAIQCSGYCMSLAVGYAKEDDLPLERNLQITKEIVRSVHVPVMADGEDGYGPSSVVSSTVRSFVEAGVSGINLEDQILRSFNDTGVIAANEMVQKLIAARSAATELGRPDFIINGRTDCLAVFPDRKRGLKEAVDRCTLYLKSGADLVFVTAVATMNEVETLVRNIPGPVSIAAGLPYNIETLSIQDLTACGVARISLPTVALFSSIRGIEQTMVSVFEHQDLAQLNKTNRLSPPKK